MNNPSNASTIIKRKSLKCKWSKYTAPFLFGACLALAMTIQSTAEEIGGPLKVNTPNGFVQIGPTNAFDWSHFITDQSRYFFDKEIHVNNGKIGAYNNSDLQLRTGQTTRIYVKKSTGNVGIGTTNPAAKLDISGNNSGSLHIGNGSSGALKLIGDAGTGNVVINNANTVGGDIDVQRRGISALFINGSDGNVGIGLDSGQSPHEKLTVKGKIVAEEVIVKESQNWPDYVFAPNYALPSLDEVEEHINTHKHLPDIPSAAEVAEKGLSMSAMLTKQMQKIEELTLYLIDLKKENERLNERVTDLEADTSQSM